MQAVYYPRNSLEVHKGEEVKVISNHSEYNLWFDVEKEDLSSISSKPSNGPDCTCGIHVALSRTHLGMMNDISRRQILTDVLTKTITDDTICLCISDGSLLPLTAARLGAKRVFTIESNSMCKKIIDRFICENNLNDNVKVIEKHPEDVTLDDLEGNKIDLVLGEPFFQTSILPWHHIQFWSSVNCLSKFLPPQTRVLPW